MRTARDDFRTFFTAENERLQRFATMLVGDPYEGAELAQEALARLYARWSRIQNGFPAAYARQIVVNLVRTRHRSKKLRAVMPLPAWADGNRQSDADTDRVGDSLRIVDALNRLSAIRRAAVVLRYYEDMSDQEIARVLDRPVGSVKSDIHRALRQLRPLLEEVSAGGGNR